MKDKKEKEKEKKGAKTSETIVEEEKAADSVETETEEKELDRESMSDEEYIAALEERVGKCVAEAASSKNVAMRLQADFDNYRKRNASLAEEMRALGKSMVIEKMLTVLDNCDLARKYISDESAHRLQHDGEADPGRVGVLRAQRDRGGGKRFRCQHHVRRGA